MNNIKKYLEKNLVFKSIQKAKELNDELNAFSQIYSELKTKNSNGKLANVPFAIKDNYDHKGFITSSSSKTLRKNKSLITATVVKRLINAGAVPIGKTNLDEFGMGGTGLASANGILVNPLDKSRIIGGSSSGSAAAVLTGIVPFALGTDTGDSIRQPSSWTGLVGFKSTWGLISRYGMHSFSPAFDTTGFITNTIEDQALLISLTSGSDDNDFTCLREKPIDLITNLNSDISNIKLAYFKEAEQIFDKKYLDKFNIFVEKLKEKGAIIEEVSFSPQLLEALYPTYQSITFAEGSSQIACLDGINFGTIIEGNKTLYENIATGRAQNLGRLIKERITIGANALNKENQNDIFIQAKKIRTLIIQEAKKIFTKYDGFINIASAIAPKVEETTLSTKTKKLTDNFFLIANMGGFPSLAIPFDKIGDLPISVEICCDVFEDQKVLNIGKAIEEINGDDK